MDTPGSMVDSPAPAGRSILVSVLGWLAIVGAVLAILAAFNQAQLYGATGEAPVDGLDPVVQEGFLRFMHGVTALDVLLAAFVMYAGYALWKRRNWARRTFIVLCALAIAANLIWVVLGALFGSLFAQAGLSFGAVFVLVVIPALACAGLFYWLIRRLRSPAVKREFTD